MFEPSTSCSSCYVSPRNLYTRTPYRRPAAAGHGPEEAVVVEQ